MNNTEFFSKCRMCKKRKFVIKIRSVVLPMGLKATSRVLICAKCAKEVQKVIPTKQ